MQCFKCGAEIPVGKMACEKCGAIAFTGQNMGGNIQSNHESVQRNRISTYNSQGSTSGGVGFSVTSLVLGIVSMLLFWTIAIGIPAGVLGVSLGGYALYRQNQGKGMAIAGLVCSIIALCLCAVMVFFIIVENS